MKRPLAWILAAILLVSAPLTALAHWSDSYYADLQSAGILDEVFGTRPEDARELPITREEFFSLIVLAASGPQDLVTELPPFLDFQAVQPGLSGYLAEAYRQGILTGVQQADGLRILPESPITRQEAATVLGRTLGLSFGAPVDFDDADTILPYAAEFVSACERTAILSGYPDSTFRPRGSITWAESVKIVSCALQGGFVRPVAVSILLGNSTRGAAEDRESLASFNAPCGLLVEGDTFYIADTDNNLIRKAVNSEITTYAGQIVGYDLYDRALGGLYNANRATALFMRPVGILRHGKTLLVLDRDNHVIRQIQENGAVVTYAGSGKAGSRNGIHGGAEFNAPEGFCADNAGNIYIADTGNHTIRRLSPDGTVSTLVGTPGVAGRSDGTDALLYSPRGVFWQNGTLYIADTSNHRICAFADGKLSIVAGAETGIYNEFGDMAGDYRDGPAAQALFHSPSSLCMSEDGTMYVADTGNGLIRRIKDGVVGTAAGFANPNAARETGIRAFVEPRGLALNDDTLYVTDAFLNTVMQVDLSGT